MQHLFACVLCPGGGGGFSSQLEFFAHLKQHYEPPDPSLIVPPQAIDQQPQIVSIEDEFSDSDSGEAILEGIRNVVEQQQQTDSESEIDHPQQEYNDNFGEVYEVQKPDILDTIYESGEMDLQATVATSPDNEFEADQQLDEMFGNNIQPDDSVMISELDELIENDEAVNEVDVVGHEQDFQIIEEIMNHDVILYKVKYTEHDEEEEEIHEEDDGDNEEDETAKQLVEEEDEDHSEDRKPKKQKKTNSYLCQICDRYFNSRNALRYHSLTHENQREFRCSTCSGAFRTNYALSIHQRIHLDERPFPCPSCELRFRQSGDLKYHMDSIHSTQKKHICEYCKKAFARKYSLELHRKIHTGVRNHVCDVCNAAFSASSYLVMHKKKHTGEKNHSCSVCDKRFRSGGDMRRHLKIHDKSKNQVEGKETAVKKQLDNRIELK